MYHRRPTTGRLREPLKRTMEDRMHNPRVGVANKIGQIEELRTNVTTLPVQAISEKHQITIIEEEGAMAG